MEISFQGFEKDYNGNVFPRFFKKYNGGYFPRF